MKTQWHWLNYRNFNAYPNIYFSLEKYEKCLQYLQTALTVFTLSISSACIKESLGVRDSQKLPWDFQKINARKSGTPNF